MDSFENALTTLDSDLDSNNSSAHILDSFIQNMREENHTIVNLVEVFFLNPMLVFIFESQMQNGTITRSMTMMTEFKNGCWDEELTLAMGTPCIWKAENNK